jgi:hypothetical protein
MLFMKYNYFIASTLCALLIFCNAFYFKAKAQECGTDAAQHQMWLQHPEFAQQEQVNTQLWAQHMQLQNSALIFNTSLGLEYEIPVVIHVMHTGGTVGSIYNPTDAMLTGMITYLNQTYAATFASYPDTSNGGTRIPIRFVLAQRDPNCATSTGIVRVDASGLTGYSTYGVKRSSTTGVMDSTIKALSLWSPTDYVNIWVVNKIDGNDGTSGTFVAGYAYIPPAPRYLDGIIMLATQAQSGKITMPHEMGHLLGLYHTFEGGNTSTCPANTNCNTDNDQVCDTQPEMQSSFNCPVDPNPCTGVSYNFVQHNFMDYSNCQDRFTGGQEMRMVFKLTTLRSGLLSSLGGVPPSGSSIASASCTPGIVLVANNADVGPTKVVLNDLQANSGGYNDDGNISYRDLTCLQRANLVMGQTYTLSVTTGSVNQENVKAWIDFNNDGIFQTGELVLTGTSVALGGTTNATITIPATAPTCVPLRLRVMSDFYGSAAPTACTNVQYGQTEDYSVYITNPISASIALSNGTNPGCLGASRTFTASSINLGTAPSYNWYVNNVLVSTNTATYTSSSFANNDSIRVKAYATTTGCRVSDTVYSTAIYLTLSATVPTPVAGSNSPLCAGNTLNLTASTISGVVYNWSGPNGFSAVVQNPSIPNTTTAASGVYSVIASTASCISNPGSVTVVVNTAPATPVAGSNSPVCTGSSITFTATSTAGATYAWTGPNSFTSPAQNPIIASAVVANAGTYSITASIAGCTAATVTISVAVGTPPAAPVAGSNSPVCAGTALNLTASTIAGATYSWAGPSGYTSTTQNPVIASATAANAGSYSVKASSGGCLSGTSNTVTVVVNPSPLAPTAGSNSPVCAGAILNLTASSVTGATYSWTGPNSFASTIQNPTIASAILANSGTYNVKTTAAGCSSAPATVAVVVNPVVTPAVTVSPVAAFIGLSTHFIATVTNGGTVPTYQWTQNGTSVTSSVDSVIATLAKGDSLCVIINSNAVCAAPATARACSVGSLAVGNISSIANDLQLYPNPNEGSFTITCTLTGSKNAHIEVVNVLGQVVHKEYVTVHNNILNKHINLNGISTGTYILKVITETGSNFIKFTLQQ